MRRRSELQQELDAVNFARVEDVGRIRHLTGEVEAWKAQLADEQRRRDIVAAELEQLKVTVAETHAQVRRLSELGDEADRIAQAEITRLRSELAERQADADRFHDDAHAAQAEVERLNGVVEYIGNELQSGGMAVTDAMRKYSEWSMLVSEVGDRYILPLGKKGATREWEAAKRGESLRDADGKLIPEAKGDFVDFSGPGGVTGVAVAS